MYKVDNAVISNVKRLTMTGGGSRGVDSVFGRHDERVGDEFTADVLLWEVAETDGCGSGVVLCVPAPSGKNGKICQFCSSEVRVLTAGENASDLHCCTHGSKVGAEQICVRRKAKASQTAMV